MLLSLQVFTVFQQQILGAFVDVFILLAGFAIFAVSDLVDDTVKVGDHMKQIEHDFGLRHFFLTALMNGSHMSITTASMPASCFAAELIEEAFQRVGLAVFSDIDHPAAQIIQDHGQIAMTLADGDLVYGQNTQTV